MKTLTPDEMEKLPLCEYDPFARCFSEKEKDTKHCVMCIYERILDNLCHDDLACAGYAMKMLLSILKELNVLPEDVKIK